MTATEPPDIVVVGSLNQDLGIGLDRTPRPGETVLGDDARWTPGGKGANQAAGCARLGLRTAMVGAVGNDAVGQRLRETLVRHGVDVTNVDQLAAPTGLAVVLVDRAGESTIVVSPGANAHLTPASVDAAGATVADARALLCQLEVPVATVHRAVQRSSGLVVLNPAPGRPLDPELLAHVDVLVPNRHELAEVVGRPVPDTLDDVAAAAATVDGPDAVVVTLGADGALVVAAGTATHVPAVPVTPLDTTGAGDSFCAGLVTELLAGATLVEAARIAVRVAAATTLREGAMASLPTRDEVEQRLGEAS